MLRDFFAPFRPPRTAALVVALVVVPLAASLAACGIKGPLKPPPGKSVAGAPPPQAPVGGTLPSETPTSITTPGGEAAQ